MAKFEAVARSTGTSLLLNHWIYYFQEKHQNTAWLANSSSIDFELKSLGGTSSSLGLSAATISIASSVDL